MLYRAPTCNPMRFLHPRLWCFLLAGRHVSWLEPEVLPREIWGISENREGKKGEVIEINNHNSQKMHFFWKGSFQTCLKLSILVFQINRLQQLNNSWDPFDFWSWLAPSWIGWKVRILCTFYLWSDCAGIFESATPARSLALVGFFSNDFPRRLIFFLVNKFDLKQFWWSKYSQNEHFFFWLVIFVYWGLATGIFQGL